MLSLFSSTVFFFNLVFISSVIRADDPCRFDHAKGTIDLTSVGRTDGKAAYPDKTPPTSADYKYSYNPCKPFTELPSCVNVAACQVSADGKYSFSIGLQNSASWNPGTGLGSLPSVTYSDGAKQASVTLQCSTDGSESLEALGESPTNFYKFRLTHKCACWDGCKNSPDTTTKSSKGGGGGIGGGAVFVLILFILVLVYFVGFALFARFRLQRTGVDLIANRTFWVALPGYAKDGAVYLYGRVANRSTNYQSV
ncbi:unnamed protein product [Adineta ricciae]|uniref:Autophagy-related protein 27 n=1 Tax=Adineta ricciae TaxID=249248 RepID=A0A814HCJ8_ADIRI|nr:unnamed protein product [Adineta ricciae]CAF1304483.1 unnamed protein product [Adineta ricciae]